MAKREIRPDKGIDIGNAKLYLCITQVIQIRQREEIMDYSFRNDSPVYLQLASILEGAIVRGEFAPGDKLPSVREIALESRTNINTVQKALARLESQGLIETRRTSGKYVCDNPETLAGQKREAAKTLCETFLRGMQALGFSASESIRLLKEGVNDGTERSSSQ